MVHDVSATLRDVLALHRSGDIEAAEQLCRKALHDAPSHPDALHILALILYQRGDLASAHDYLKEAIYKSPGNASYHKNFSIICGALGQLDDAVKASRHVVHLEPESADGLAALGHILVKTNHIEEAELALTASLKLRPDHSDAMKSLGQLYIASDRYSDAELILKQVIGLTPTDTNALTLHGHVLAKLQKYGDALDALRKARLLDPSSKSTGMTLADTLVRTEQPSAALEVMEDLLEQHPNDPDILSGTGHILRDLNHIDAATQRFVKALNISPEHVDAHVNIGLTQLASGEFETAWDHYHYRSQQHETIAQWPTQTICNRNASDLLSGQFPVIVWTEQGLGDEILQASLVPDIAVTAKDLTLICSERLTSLFAQSFPGVRVMTSVAAHESGVLGTTEAAYPLLSLGKTLRQNRALFPKYAGYLCADAHEANKLRAKYKAMADSAAEPFVVSLSWLSGNALYGKRNTIPLEQWLPILQVTQRVNRPIVFIVSQYGYSADEVNAAAEMSGTKIHIDRDVDHSGDLRQVAAQLAASDLVISTSTTTAQLAGALGRPVWHLPATGLACGWYWLTKGDTTPWYPSMRQFRRTERETDGKQIGDVAQALIKHLNDLK